MKCIKCRKEKDEIQFRGKYNRIVKQCSDCREKCKKWRVRNKERVKLYNKFTNEKNRKSKIKVIYAKHKNHEKWIRYKNQRQAAIQLGLYPSNINKVIKGKLSQTGGYEFKIVEEEYEKKNLNWKTIKQEKNIIDKVKGFPSQHRVLHEIINDIIGKKCCTCKKWNPLTNYNKSKTHWDKLRNDCKDCLVFWRKKNRKKINTYMKKYEKERKKKDPLFKLVKTLRNRLNSALSRKNVKRNTSIIELTGVSLLFLKSYLEGKFTEGMTWENHGEWHIDHIKPCCAFDLRNYEEQKKCFHYTNLQPLWAKDNLQKGGKY